MSVNAHTHLYSALVRYFPARVKTTSLLDALETLWWPLDRALDHDLLRASARLYVAEALRLGTRVIIDHHESPSCIEGSLDVIADVCQDMGMSALVCYGATERNGGLAEAWRGLAECRRFIESNRRPLVRGAIGLHAAFTVSDETIREAGTLCRELGVPLHVHVAEDVIDANGFARLRANHALLRGSILAHGVYMRPDDVREAERTGCWLVHNPRSNRANGVGYASSLRYSSRVALGTDGFPSDLDDEAEAMEERVDVIDARMNGGDALAAELGLHASAARRDIDFARIEAEAVAAAAILWERMGRGELRPMEAVRAGVASSPVSRK